MDHGPVEHGDLRSAETKRELGPQTGLVHRAESGPRFELPPERRRGRFASPQVILFSIPLIVLAVGLALTIVGQAALNRLSTKMTMQRFDQETRRSTQHLESALSQADAVLSSLPQIARDVAPLLPEPEKPRFAALSRELLHLATGRPGVTQVYLGFPSGHFLTVHPGEPATPIQLTRAGVTTTYRLSPEGLVPVESVASGFDPTERSWYRLGLLTREKAWTEPYNFFGSGQVGVTRVMPIHAAGMEEVVSVAGVDFDVNTLTTFMAEDESQERHSFIFTERGVVLAYPAGQTHKAELRHATPGNQPGTFADPLLDDFFRARRLRLPTSPESRWTETTTYLSFESRGVPMVAAVRNLGQNGPAWFVATLSKKKDAQSALLQYRRSSLIIGSLAVVVAMILSWFFARFIIRERRDAVLARAAAKAAQKHARDLGSYTLLSRLGEGGMGEVWRARHHLLAREAAIKLIRTGERVSGTKKQELEERFRREARALAALRSRNTIELFDYGLTSDGTLYYVMELLDGIDLHALVEQFGAQPPERVRQILIQTCNSLGEAHEVQLVHRDIKPANIFLCRAADEVDVVKVLDFGLVLSPLEAARERHPASLPSTRSPRAGTDATEARLTQADMQLGTPGFMSPEQALGAETDARADLYSLGCVAWWLLTGRPLFEGDSAVGVMLKHIQADVPPLRDHCPFPLSPEFERLVMRCLRKNPDERPSTARRLLRDLLALEVQGDGWTRAQATDWWATRVPQEPRPPANVTDPPGPPEADRSTRMSI